MEEYLRAKGWDTVYKGLRPARARKLFGIEDLQLGAYATRYAKSQFPLGLYQHQLLALQSALKGHHTCLATGTASGKSAVFYCAALDLLQRNPQAKVLALYPMKALAREQEDRWKAAMAAARLPSRLVCRIDGDVLVSSRARLLKEASIVLATPDVCHAWLLPSMGQAQVWRFIRDLALIVVDEVHVYSGVFGSNSAFLFRRLQHAMSIAGRSPTYLAASATIRNPDGHLRMLFGQDFGIIGPSTDTSPQYDLLTNVSELTKYLAISTSHRFIVFVDSRKQTELISSIVARARTAEAEHEDQAGESDEGLEDQGELDSPQDLEAAEDADVPELDPYTKKAIARSSNAD
jgi:DEAD/DEAH box helicase domain-containing protein